MRIAVYRCVQLLLYPPDICRDTLPSDDGLLAVSEDASVTSLHKLRHGRHQFKG